MLMTYVAMMATMARLILEFGEEELSVLYVVIAKSLSYG